MRIFQKQLWIKEFWADPLKRECEVPNGGSCDQRENRPDSEIIKVCPFKPGSVVDWVAERFLGQGNSKGIN